MFHFFVVVSKNQNTLNLAPPPPKPFLNRFPRIGHVHPSPPRGDATALKCPPDVINLTLYFE